MYRPVQHAASVISASPSVHPATIHEMDDDDDDDDDIVSVVATSQPPSSDAWTTMSGPTAVYSPFVHFMSHFLVRFD